ncbi:MAG: hypothetical protein AAGG46_08965, partial [Planctomycetota bacterium]
TASTLTVAAAAAEPRCVLLRNGNVIVGEVRLIDNEYVVNGEGFEVRLPADSVRHVADSRRALADWQRAATPRPTVEHRLRLADWCGRQRLWGYAVQELLAAQRESPDDPRVAAAQRRLWHDRELALQATAHREEEPTRRVKRDPAVKLAGYAAATTPSTDRSRPLPDGALQEFTRTIQPILVNNCTTAGCHAGGDPSGFALNRDLLHSVASRRSTDSNLAAVLRAIDAGRPAGSHLLAAMQPSHAGGRGPRLGPRHDELLARVRNWVHTVAGSSPSDDGVFSESTSVAAGEDDTAIEKTPGGVASGDDFGGDAAFGDDLASGDVYAPGYYEALLQPAASPTKLEPTPTPTAPPTQRGVRLKRARPRDEFDPAEFNERFGDAAVEPLSNRVQR